MASICDTGVVCEFAECRRPRAFSMWMPGRFGGFTEMDSEVLGCVDGINVVMRHTFLELRLNGDDIDSCEIKSCCSSDHASESTAAISKNDDFDSWSADVTDDECEEEKPKSMPPGNFGPPKPFAHSSVNAVPLPMMMMAAAVRQEHTVASQFLWKPNVEVEKTRFLGSVWGSKKKVKKEQTYTTIVIKNLPEKCTNAMIVELLDTAGFAGKYDFLYAPTDFRNYSAFGYAFVNMISHELGESAIQHLDGMTAWSENVPVSVDWSQPHQGYGVHVRRYQNSPVMHPLVPEEYKPMIFRGGVQQKFPAPTKRIKEPRLRRGAVTGSTNE